MAEIHAKKIDEKKMANLLQKDVVIKGEVHFAGSALIRGKVQGGLDSKSELIIEKNAEIGGNIQVSRLQIHGSITGNIHSTESVYIENSARVTGDISTPNLHIDSGSFFEGRSIMNGKLNS
ncbi:MAG: polymer-forming cytoskeletal protein [Spirochaetota bacterium]